MPAWGKKRVMWGTGDSQWGGANLDDFRENRVSILRDNGGELDGDAKTYYSQSGNMLRRPSTKTRKYTQSWGTVTDGGEQWDVQETDTFSFKRHVERRDGPGGDGGDGPAAPPRRPRNRRGRINAPAPARPQAPPEVRAVANAGKRPRVIPPGPPPPEEQARINAAKRPRLRAPVPLPVPPSGDLSPEEQKQLDDVIATAQEEEADLSAAVLASGARPRSRALRDLLASAPPLGGVSAPLVEEPIFPEQMDLDWDFTDNPRENLQAVSPQASPAIRPANAGKRPRKRARVEEVAPFDPAAARAAAEEARQREIVRLRERAERVATNERLEAEQAAAVAEYRARAGEPPRSGPRRSTRARSGRTYYDEEYGLPRGRGMPQEYSDDYSDYSDEYSDEYSD